VFQALWTAPIIVTRTLEAAGTLPSSYQVDRIAAEPADQVIGMKLVTTLTPIELHGQIIQEVQGKASPENTGNSRSWSRQVLRIDVRMIGLFCHATLRLYLECSTADNF